MWQTSWVYPWNWVVTIDEMSRKIVFKCFYLQSWEISSNTGLLEFDLAKCYLRLLPLPKVKLKEDFRNMFYFTLPFFQAFFKRSINNELKFILVNFISDSIVLYYTQFNKRLWDHSRRKTLGKTLDFRCKSRAMTHVFRKIKSSRQHALFCGLPNWCLYKQLVSPLSWNNPLSETSLDALYILTIIDIHMPRKNTSWILREFIT